tara:strand:- start:840 stop:995 length:156 start_codon:yes stop_codon:yes gene_type:complete
MPYLLTIKSTVGAKKLINNYFNTTKVKKSPKKERYYFFYGVYFKEETKHSK